MNRSRLDRLNDRLNLAGIGEIREKPMPEGFPYVPAGGDNCKCWRSEEAYQIWQNWDIVSDVDGWLEYLQANSVANPNVELDPKGAALMREFIDDQLGTSADKAGP